jgi:hypothetical protein
MNAMKGRRVVAHGLGVLLTVLASGPAAAISKCIDEGGQIHYLQASVCPDGLRPLDLDLPRLGVIDSGDGAVDNFQAQRVSSSDRRRGRERMHAAVACIALKRDFAATNEPCRGVAGCRQRQQRRELARQRYASQRCAFSAGDIDSLYPRTSRANDR